MKKVFYLPHLILIAIAGALVSLLGWDAADDYLGNKFGEIQRRANS
jgi:hypothetical protein